MTTIKQEKKTFSSETHNLWIERIKKLFLLFVLILSISEGMAQEISHSQWTEFKNFEGIKIEYRIIDCDNEEGRSRQLYLLQFTNSTTDKVSLSWKLQLWHENKCSNCHKMNSGEFNKTIVLEPNSTIIGNCQDKIHNERFIFSKFVSPPPGSMNKTLTDFRFINLKKEILK